MKNISKIISTVFLSFSILLLCYVFYRSQVFYNGTKFDYYFKYYVITFLFIFLSFISFFIPKKLKINIPDSPFEPDVNQIKDRLKQILKQWQVREYPSDEYRWKSYYKDVQKLVNYLDGDK